MDLHMCSGTLPLFDLVGLGVLFVVYLCFMLCGSNAVQSVDGDASLFGPALSAEKVLSTGPQTPETYERMLVQRTYNLLADYETDSLVETQPNWIVRHSMTLPRVNFVRLIAEYHEDLKASLCSYFAAVQFFDRVMSLLRGKSDAQSAAIALTCLAIAFKYHDDEAAEAFSDTMLINWIVKRTGIHASLNDVVRLQLEILKELKFRLHLATVYTHTSNLVHRLWSDGKVTDTSVLKVIRSRAEKRLKAAIENPEILDKSPYRVSKHLFVLTLKESADILGRNILYSDTDV
ncbi:hypothetical protein HDU93_004734 [Gonapodya sp. JEL0774]|nr:hypothetical protein HDU93_004734 [Gonapodya sp. JEL0774]